MKNCMDCRHLMVGGRDSLARGKMFCADRYHGQLLPLVSMHPLGSLSQASVADDGSEADSCEEYKEVTKK